MTIATRALQTRFFSALESIGEGRLIVTTPDGARLNFGSQGPEAEVRIRDWRLLRRLMLRGDVGLAEGWISGDWHSDTLEGALSIAMRNQAGLAQWSEPSRLQSWRMRLVDRLVRANSLRGSSRNIRAHYDVGNEFYQLWLDRGMTYSSAIFAGDDNLEQAQARKNDRILSQLAPGESLLEIGCGWGGFAEAASGHGHRVTGITLSPSQKGYADARLDGRAEIRLQDYRAVTGRFDNLVSIEMVEAVGERYWPTYFATLKARLAKGGRAVLQAITVPDAEFSVYRRRSDFIRQHVFPGGMLPCSASIAHAAAQAGLRVQDSYAFGQDYARTCRIWSQRMIEERTRIQRLNYGDAFLRSWQFYLEGCAAAFATGRCDVVQVTLGHEGA
ncbi:cyclopropane-fatty-acyl-phospholipid synthase family protein [Sedimentimonas flavescens]|uniref:Cyclopropane-fatty-acyl-phospholipid synthase family protein n=1 Tax=Sedimentimonas flavescens TaxID=2851012 RepID=A0ABT3A2Z7_9RHOB|nr:cyclopropane-fatty-acyl-phospholipid synthase family protein [Sedimentimonas flavescens]MBW0159511.1 cyclopropane-fatty-acyl-phospholipid synthase family protein [Sedimentimonas flavescens]MCV2880351.1 cyclopropane-fatty-acyl-phospholipid synthase family protein [Sedimentimonas flavescens]WBL32248.1 cyclopropane-fatty-acyl-phospholipid synthase [Sinirhodobacter sp. HNIBRBA609]